MEALKTFVLLVLIIFSIREHKKISMSIYRDRLFVIRGELFILPTKYGISYDDKIYRHLERVINNQIRFAHKLSYLNLFFFERYLNKKKIHLKNKIEISTEEYPEDLKKELEHLRGELTRATVYYLMKTSPMFWIVTAFTLLRTINITSEDIKIGVSVKKMNDCISIMASENKLGKMC